MPMSSEKKAKLLLDTSEAAGAFVEDMGHIRDTLAKADRTTPGEIRRLSAVLRRLLIHDDLRSISSPRIGALSLLIPNNPIYHAARKQSVRIFLSGGLSVFNNEVRAIVTSMTGNFRLDPAFDKTKTATVTLEGFLNQKVLAHNNKWATRGQVIKYIANKSSGVHSKSTNESSTPADFEVLLSVIRKCLRFTKQGDTGIKISVDWSAFGGIDSSSFTWTPDSIDGVLIELLCAAHFLSVSPDVHSLEFAIHKEFGFPQFDRDSI
jgi:hypothetical protein